MSGNNNDRNNENKTESYIIKSKSGKSNMGLLSKHIAYYLNFYSGDKDKQECLTIVTNASKELKQHKDFSPSPIFFENHSIEETEAFLKKYIPQFSEAQNNQKDNSLNEKCPQPCWIL